MLEGVDNGEDKVDIFNYLQYMRTRRINMVQTMVGYLLISYHHLVLFYISSRSTRRQKLRGKELDPLP